MEESLLLFEGIRIIMYRITGWYCKRFFYPVYFALEVFLIPVSYELAEEPPFQRCCGLRPCYMGIIVLLIDAETFFGLFPEPVFTKRLKCAHLVV